MAVCRVRLLAAPLGFPHRGNPRFVNLLARPRLRSGTVAARIFKMLLKACRVSPLKLIVKNATGEQLDRGILTDAKFSAREQVPEAK